MCPLQSDDDVDGVVPVVNNFAFSATNINDLGADAYTLFGLILDKSGSVGGFENEIETCTQNVIKGCQNAPRADNMLVRTLTFDRNIDVVHDFKLLNDCAPNNYKGIITAGSTTSLYDASVNIVESVAAAGKDLMSKDYAVNGIVCIITDGEDVGSKYTAASVRAAIEKAKRSECLESLLVILIGVNVKDARIGKFLQQFKDDAGIDQYIEVDKADPKTFAKIAGFIVQSVSSQSQSLGSGSASQTITF
jgi:uncharacterized protein YegL